MTKLKGQTIDRKHRGVYASGFTTKDQREKTRSLMRDFIQK